MGYEKTRSIVDGRFFADYLHAEILSYAEKNFGRSCGLPVDNWCVFGEDVWMREWINTPPV